MRRWTWQELWQNKSSTMRSRRVQRMTPEALEARVLPAINLVSDINTATRSSAPDQFLQVGTTTFFTADDGVHGIELWKTDGTPAGTQLVKDINPGNGIYAGSYPNQLTSLNGMLYFTADSGNGELELWRSDGTASGTTLVKDLSEQAGALPWGLTVMNNTLYFSADDGVHGRELWKSDGTANGTSLVADLNPAGDGIAFETQPVAIGNVLYFAANDGTNGQELWRTDGTANGTSRVVNLNGTADGLPSFAPGSTAAFNGLLYFAGQDATNGLELWQSDGTSGGTVLVQNIGTGVAHGAPRQLTVAGDYLFFTANTATQGRELWRVAFGQSGASFMKDIRAGDASSEITELTALGNSVLFSATDGSNNGRELWKSDGTSGGTVLVTNIAAGGSDSNPLGLIRVGTHIYFMADNGSQGAELWRSNGSAGGTTLVKDIRPGVASAGEMASGMQGINVSGTLYFTANDGASGVELWRTDGTAGGTFRIRDLNVVTDDSTPTGMAPIERDNDSDGLIFAATDSATGTEIWFTNGAATQTVRLVDIRSGAEGSAPLHFLSVGNIVYFTAITGSQGRELWRTDGTTEGTSLLADIQAGPSSSDPADLTLYNGEIYFSATTSSQGRELWKTDGTLSGTVLVADLVADGGSSDPGELTVVGQTLFFRAATDQLWKIDENGTSLVLDISTANTVPLTQLTAADNRLFFVADDGTHGNELWASDGTPEGTLLLKDIGSNSASGQITEMVALGNTLLFTANNGTHGSELWTSDGTPAGTAMLLDLLAGPNSSLPQHLTLYQGAVYFSANDGTNGFELWKSNGTVNGTMLVCDITPGMLSSYPQELAVVNGLLYFSGFDDAHGFEPWRSNGTAGQTVRLGDLNPGKDSSLPRDFTAVGNHLIFVADDGIHGFELFSDIDNRVPLISGQELGIQEFAPQGSTVGTVIASDPDAGQVLTYAIVSGNTGNVFALNALTGELTVLDSAAIDLELNSQFSLVIRVTDNGDPNFSATATITVTIGEQNRSPNFADQSFFRAENSANGTPVGTLVASDPDAGQTLQFEITGGNQTAFAVHPVTGEITVANSAELDFETTPTITFQVTVTDNGDPAASVTRTITIQITDADDPLQMILPGTGVTYPRRASAVVINAAAAVVDPDQPDLNFNGAKLTVRLTQGVLKTDKLEIVAGGGITRKGKWVLFNGTKIGSLKGGKKTQPLEVTLLSTATAQSTQQLLRQVGFSNKSKKTPAATRTVEFRLTIGGQGLPASQTITLQ